MNKTKIKKNKIKRTFRKIKNRNETRQIKKKYNRTIKGGMIAGSTGATGRSGATDLVVNFNSHENPIKTVREALKEASHETQMVVAKKFLKSINKALTEGLTKPPNVEKDALEAN